MTVSTQPVAPVTFGVKSKDYVDAGGEGGDWIHRISKDGEYRFRFLEPLDDWTVYWEHFSAEKKTSYPCTGDRNECPGCTCGNENEAKASAKYLVNAIQQNPGNDKQGYAHIWKLPHYSLQEDLERYNGRAGTIMDRDYTVYRYNQKGKTNYSVDREDKDENALDLSKFKLQDHQEALKQAWMEVWDPETRAAKQKEFEDRKAAKEKKAASIAADEEPEADLEKEPISTAGVTVDDIPYALLSPEEKAKRDKPTLVVDEEPKEEAPLTTSRIRKMSFEDLRATYKRAGIDIPEDYLDTEVISEADRVNMAEYLIEQLS